MKGIYLILTIILMLIIFSLSITPGISVAGSSINSGFMQHLLAYFLLSFLVLKSTNKFKLAIFLSGAYGFLIETIQYVIPYRAFQVSDIFFNFLGACFVLALKLKK